jgi:glycogen debranching enzyme
MEPMVHLVTGREDVNRAFRIALGDVIGNITPFQSGLLEKPAAAILAGLDYVTPWTRDAAINVWNACGLLLPEVSRNTLLSVLMREENGTVRVGGQYWDAIIWVLGAWNYYLYTGDRPFLELAHQAAVNSLAYFERTEFDAETGLFRGPAVYGDGVAAYPKRYTEPGGYGDIREWIKHNPEKGCPVGEGNPMQTLSTNCVYYSAYGFANRMAKELGVPEEDALAHKEAKLKTAINKSFWDAETGRYRYLLDPWGGCDHQEGMGHSLAILLGVADAEQAATIFEKMYVSPAGLPCVWPTYPRYPQYEAKELGRHSGTVWPHIQGFWGCAAAEYGRADLLAHELNNLTEHANRDGQFYEIYHPETGLPYGGIQEYEGEPMHAWPSCRRQTWSATAYLRLLLMGVLGMRFAPEGLRFSPCVPEGFGEIRLNNLPYRNMLLDITLNGNGHSLFSMKVDGKVAEILSTDFTGKHAIELILA